MEMEAPTEREGGMQGKGMVTECKKCKPPKRAGRKQGQGIVAELYGA